MRYIMIVETEKDGKRQFVTTVNDYKPQEAKEVLQEMANQIIKPELIRGCE